MSRLKAVAAYLAGVLAATAFAGALTPTGSSDPWVIMRLLYYIAFMSMFFFLPAILVALASGKPLRKGLVVLSVICGGAIALFLKAWLFNPSCRHATLWEPMCFKGVKAAMALGADGVAVVLAAHIVGVALWMVALKLLAPRSGAGVTE
jgi:hypothetical protein